MKASTIRRRWSLMSYLTDVCGSRLTWSPEYKAAADWTASKFTEWKLQNVHQESWAPFRQEDGR